MISPLAAITAVRWVPRVPGQQKFDFAVYNRQFVNKTDEENHMKLDMRHEGGGASGGWEGMQWAKGLQHAWEMCYAFLCLNFNIYKKKILIVCNSTSVLEQLEPPLF